jgi:hypothetical protein
MRATFWSISSFVRESDERVLLRLGVPAIGNAIETLERLVLLNIHCGCRILSDTEHQLKIRHFVSKPLALLVFPPVYDFAFYDLFVKPFGLLKIGKAFQDAGFRVKLINCLDYADEESVARYEAPKRQSNGTGKIFRQRIATPGVFGKIERSYSRYGILHEVIEQKLCEEKPDIVLVSSGMTYWYEGVKEVVALSKRLYPDIPVVVGGIYASLMPEHAIHACGANYAVSGDTFGQLALICAELKLPIPLQNNSGTLIHETMRDAAAIRLNIGCPFSCDYCASGVVTGGFQNGDPFESAELIKRIHRELGTINFAFYDDALLVNKNEVLIPFLEEIVRSGLSLRFYLPNGIHLTYLDLDLARLMKRTGFCDIRIGFESSSMDFHDAYDSKLETGMLGEKIVDLRDAGFAREEIGIYILAGLPGQPKGEVEQTIRYVSGLGVRVRICEYSPVPGAPLWEESVRRSSFPIEEEPLTHNNSILPMQWEGLTLRDLGELKHLAHDLLIGAGP